MDSHNLAVAILSHARPLRTEHLLDTLRRYTVRDDFDILVSEDRSVPPGSGKPRTSPHAEGVSLAFRLLCQKYNARHVCPDHRIGLEGSVHQAMNNTMAPFVLMCSDDILFTQGAMDSLLEFYESNEGNLEHLAGQHVHVWHAHTPETEDLISLGLFKLLNEFYPPDFLHIRDGHIPRHPEDSLGICSGFHGSIGVISRKHWDAVGGVSLHHWIWDQSYCAQAIMKTDGVFIRFPMPTLAHFGAASFFYGEDFPQGKPSDTGHRGQLEIFCAEMGEPCEDPDEELEASRRISRKCDEIVRGREDALREWLHGLKLPVSRSIPT